MVFLAGLGSGVTEAVLVVTPAEVCKIRMQAQFHSMLDPEQMANRKYRNVLQTAGVVVREEGVGALYKGLLPTTLRQGCNQVLAMFNKLFKALLGACCLLFACGVFDNYRARPTPHSFLNQILTCLDSPRGIDVR